MKKKIFPIAILFLILISCSGHTENDPLSDDQTGSTSEEISPAIFQQPDIKHLPGEIKVKGEITNSSGWKDQHGEHLVFTSETGIFTPDRSKDKEDMTDLRSAEVFVYHYIKKENADNYVLSWRVHDHIVDCPVDLDATFVKNTFQVTDLDKDGEQEVWLMYKTVCHGDVSPYEMKIILYEGNDKYAVRGENKVVLEGQSYGGKYKFDKKFKEGPQEFRDFAKKLWEKNLIQKW